MRVKALTNYITALADFVAAELDAFRRKAVRTAMGVGVMLCAAVIAVWGAGLFFAALFIWIAPYLGASIAAVITGGAALLAAGIVAGIGLWLSR